MKQLTALLLCFLILFSTALTASAAEETPTQPSVEGCSAVLLYHFSTDQAIVQKNIDTALPAGSTSKILAGLLACETLESRLDESVTITSSMVATASGYRLYIKAGDVLTVEELLYVALCGSYNDAYDILAHLVGGSIKDFIGMMNARAAELGAVNTIYTDVSGIADSSVTTAADLSRIASSAAENELYMRITSTPRYAFNGSLLLDAKTITNRNELIASNQTTQYYNSLCKGMSAGYTGRGGNCVITVADDGSDRYLCILLGGEEIEGENLGYGITNRLIKWVYQAYAYTEVLTPERVICTLPVKVSDMTSEVEVRTQDTLSCYLPRAAEFGNEITYSVRLLHTELEAPVTEGQHVGYVAVLYQGKSIGTLPIYTADSAERSGFIGQLVRMKELTGNRIFLAGAIFFILSLSAWVITETVIRRRRRHKWDKYFSTKMTPSADALKPRRTQPNDDRR